MLSKEEIQALGECRHVDKNKELSVAFKKVIYSYVLEVRKVPKKYERQITGGLDIALRILTGSHATFVSRGMIDWIIEEKLKVNPFDLRWEHRHLMGGSFYGGRKMSVAVWEHTIPIRQFREELLTLTSLESVEDAINNYPGVAWITRDEDRRLSKNGFQKNRPDGFIKCYEKAGIELMNEEMYKHTINL